VAIIANRCSAVGSSSETWLSKGLKETAVLLNGWNATFVAPSSGEPELTCPTARRTGHRGEDWLCGIENECWQKSHFVSQHRRPRYRIESYTAVDGEIVYVKKGTPELATQLVHKWKCRPDQPGSTGSCWRPQQCLPRMNR